MTASTCTNGDLGERSRLYNDSTLDVVTKAFKSHFKAQVGSVLKEIKYNPLALSVQKLATRRSTLNQKPFALKVHYGLKGDEFYPVFEFMSENGATAEPMGTYYLAVAGELKEAVAPLPLAQTLIDDYKKNIRILRSDAVPKWDTLIPENLPFGDPCSEWFQFL
ncbi:MAG: hypothetical protein IPP33_14015 [Flavobacteriales bacterium]|nr:hypothetical protein [Flavobacteriales bacterium]